MTRAALLLTTVLVACAPSPGPHPTRNRLISATSFVRVPPPSAPDDWSCANWTRDAWRLQQTDSGLAVRPIGPGDGDVVRLTVPGGDLRGVNSGEFGGSVTFRDSLTGTETEILQDNPVALVADPPNVIMVAGLGHMGLRRGHVVSLHRATNNAWSTTQVVDLGIDPDAVVQVSPDTLLIATSEGILTVSLRTGTVHQLFRNEEWYQVSANSIERGPDGTIYVGMRRAVGVLEPGVHGYSEPWLVPATCPRLEKPTTGYSCTCAS